MCALYFRIKDETFSPGESDTTRTRISSLPPRSQVTQGACPGNLRKARHMFIGNHPFPICEVLWGNHFPTAVNEDHDQNPRKFARIFAGSNFQQISSYVLVYLVEKLRDRGSSDFSPFVGVSPWRRTLLRTLKGRTEIKRRIALETNRVVICEGY